MSYKVLLILEDYVLDQYVAKPLMDRIVKDLNRPAVRVDICTHPRFRGNRGETGVLNLNNMLTVLDIYPMYNLYILITDRDGVETRKAQLDGLERAITPRLRPEQQFIAQEAHQEVEVWLLAGHTLPREWDWDEVRREPNPKERFFAPFVASKNVADALGGGRKVLMIEALERWPLIQKRCQSDIGTLQDRIRQRIIPA